MIHIENKPYMTLHEFMEYEDKTFPEFIKAPLFASDEEKKIVSTIIEVNKILPGYIKYICNETNTRYIAELKNIINKQPVTQRSNTRIFDIVTSVTLNLGISMPVVYMYSEEDVYAFNENSEIGGLISGNAFTMGTRDMLYVFVSESIIDNNKLTDEEIGALIGHEIGHAMANHQVYSQVFINKIFSGNKVGSATIKWDEVNSLYFSNRFSRLNEFTADRAALLAVRQVAPVEGLLRKINDGDSWDYNHSQSTHPNGKARVEAVKLFASSTLYAQCIEQIDNITIDKSGYPLGEKQLSESVRKLI